MEEGVAGSTPSAEAGPSRSPLVAAGTVVRSR